VELHRVKQQLIKHRKALEEEVARLNNELTKLSRSVRPATGRVRD